HRDEFGGAAAGPRALGEERDPPRPADIDEVRKGRLPIGRPEILVTPQRHGGLKGAVIADAPEIVVAAKAGRGGTPEQIPQRALLHRGGIPMGEPPRPEPGVKAQERGCVDHWRAGSGTLLCGKVERAGSGSSGTLICSPRRQIEAQKGS